MCGAWTLQISNCSCSAPAAPASRCSRRRQRLCMRIKLMVLDISSGGDMVSCQIGFRDLEGPSTTHLIKPLHFVLHFRTPLRPLRRVRFSVQRLGRPMRNSGRGCVTAERNDGPSTENATMHPSINMDECTRHIASLPTPTLPKGRTSRTTYSTDRKRMLA